MSDTVMEPPPQEVPQPKSYAPEVFVQGQWSRNALRFATREEAEASALDLMSRWTMVQDFRAGFSEDPVNYHYDTATGVVTNIETGKGHIPARSVTL